MRQAFHCNIAMRYILNGSSTDINSNYIKYILVEDMYESNIMPLVYVSVAVPNELYTTIISHESDGQFYLNVERQNVYSNTSIKHKSFSGLFTYMSSTSNPNYVEVLDVNTSTADNAYKVITVALMSMELLNAAKTSFNGIYGNIDTATLISKTLEGLNCVVKAPVYNTVFETEVIPALNSRKKLLSYIFQQSPFYDTNFIYFMDFDKTYLLDMNGEGCEVPGDGLHSVLFDISKVTTAEAYLDGIEEVNGAYMVYINPADTNVTPNKGQDKTANQIVNITEAGDVDWIDLDINRNIGSTTKQRFSRGTSSILEKNILESNTVIIELSKTYLDGSIFTPNKKYSIHNYADYANYNGTYTLLYKREIIHNEDGVFKSSVKLGLRKVGNIKSIGSELSNTISRTSSAVYNYNANPEYTTEAYAGTKTTNVARKTSGGYSSIGNPQPDARFAGPVKKIKARKSTDSLKKKFK
jgi:hypothetical protein